MKPDLRPMLCHEADSVPKDDGRWVMEQKLDGWRFMFWKDGDRVRSFAGRNNSERTGETIALEKELVLLPEGTILDGELLASEKGVAVSTALARGLPMEFVAFDVPYLMGADLHAIPWEVRRVYLEQMMIMFDPGLIREPTLLRCTQATAENLMLAGAEGVVCKRKDSLYVPRRSPQWVKIKAEATMDGEVTGFEPGTGSWEGSWGAFRLKLENGVVTTIRMKDDEMRLGVAADPSAYLSRIVEIKHNGLGKDGAPRHPRFLRWREDKDTTQGEVSA